MKQKKTKLRTHKVTYAHRKSYRKRHIGGLFIVGVLLFVVATNAATYFAATSYKREIASDSIPVAKGTSAASDVRSSYGFTVSYDSKRYFASAIDNSSGGLHLGGELATTRTYETIRLSEQGYGESQGNSLLVKYLPTVKGKTDLTAIEDEYALSGSPAAAKGASSELYMSDALFRRTVWQRTISAGSVKLPTSFVTYTGIVDGSPLILTVHAGLTTTTDRADNIAKMVRLSQSTAQNVSYDSDVLRKKAESFQLLDTLMMTSSVSAASSAPTYTGAERISTTYGASVVKVYNTVAGDIAVDGTTVIKDYLGSVTGSGFVVSGKGDIATNGHVVVNDVRDITITTALKQASAGNTQLFQTLLQMSGATAADFAGITDQTELRKKIIEKLYQIGDGRFKFVNEKTNLLVGLSEDQIDSKELIEQTQKKLTYKERATIKQAKLVSFDFGSQLLRSATGTFKNSDVALIRIEGLGYPNVALGSVDAVSQGSRLNIVGFPGIGSNNGLIDKTQTSATLTTGSVSAIKKDTNKRTLIETDAGIGHGNSGGPAFSDDGQVVGIATYTVDPGQGDGVLSYVRDISDFTELADKSSVDYKTVSETQVAWNLGIDKFYDAHYKSAIPYFKKAQSLYENHPRAAQMIAVSERRIAEGKNIDDASIVPGLVMVSTVLLLIAGGVIMIMVVRHHKAHAVYQQHVGAGTAPPLTPDTPPQYMVAYPQPQQYPAQPTSPGVAQTSNTSPVQEPIPPQPVPSQYDPNQQSH